MGLFPKKDKHVYGDYSDEVIKENFSLNDEGIIPVGQRQNINHAPHALTPDEVKAGEPIKPVADIPMHSAGQSLYKKMMDARKGESVEAEQKSEDVKQQTKSLLDRCSQFVGDDKDATILTGQPAYVLDSVENIIAEAERKAQERVQKLYGGASTVEKVAPKATPAPVEEKPVVAEEPVVTEEPVIAEEPVKVYEPAKAKEDIASSSLPVTLEPIPEEEPSAPEQNAKDATADNEDVKNYQYRFADEDRSSETTEEKTITFWAIKEDKDEGDADSAQNEDEGGQTQSFDALGDTMPIPELHFEAEPIMDIEEEEIDEEELFGDYETVADAIPIEKNLRSVLRKLNIRAIVTLLLAVFLTLTATPLFNPIRESDPVMLSIASTIALAACAGINFDIFKSFAGKAACDLPAALSTVFSFIYGIVCIATQNYTLAQLGFISAFSIFFSVIGKRSTAKRRLLGFLQIADDNEKYALTLIDESAGSYAIAHDAVEGEALIAAGKKTVNITHYLKNSQSYDPFAGKAYGVTIASVAVAVLAAIYGLITDSPMQALYLFAAFMAIGAPMTGALIGTLPHKMAAKKLADYGAMLSSYEAAEQIEQANAVVYDINSIFPRGKVKMYDMKVLSPNNLEETIFNAAAITTSIGSPLGHVFRRIARTSEDYVLPASDSVKYEKRLGISGWVGDHSLLIGNRTLMETHGVSIPSVDFDKKILRQGFFPVYVATDGRPCALLIVGYEADRDIQDEMHRLTRMGVVILVNNCDPNVTEEMLCDYFGLPQDFVKVMQSGSVRQYKEKTEFCESVNAKASFMDGAEGISAIISSSIRIKRLTTIMTVLHILLGLAGLAAAAVLVMGGFMDQLIPINIALYLAASLIAVLLAPFFYRP